MIEKFEGLRRVKINSQVTASQNKHNSPYGLRGVLCAVAQPYRLDGHRAVCWWATTGAVVEYARESSGS